MAKVKVYTTEFCPWCMKTKEFLKANKIKFTEIDVGGNEKAAKEMIEKSGQMSVPVIDIDSKIIIGFNEEELRKTLRF